jgi:predicted ATP-dependent endonuclease of OLD family
LKLIQIQINHFRNFIDSSLIDIQSDITCLVGKNESGKTALLQSLYCLMPARKNFKFSVADHYPAWLEKQHRLKNINLDQETPIIANFRIEEADVLLVEEAFGENILMRKELTLTRNYSGVLDHDIQVDEMLFIKKLISKYDIPQYLLKELSKKNSITLLFDNIESIKGRTNVSVEVRDVIVKLEEEIKSILDENKNLKEAVWSILQPIIPHFFYFSQYSTLPYSVDIDKVLSENESDLNDGEITARSLLRMAAADNDFLLNPDYERRKRELENVANSLSEDVLTYWSQNPSLRVNPDITQKTIDISGGKTSVIDELKIRIWDQRHLLSLPFDEHSTGFQWFFSFLAAFSEFEFKDTPVIILLDEPALGLHARAQADYLRFIEERLAPKHQVIYTTHSPFMIQPDNLERVRTVEDQGRDSGAKVSSDILSTDPDTLFPLQGALGYDLIQHLFINEHNLVLEGTSDYTYLTVISDYLKEIGKSHLNQKWSIVPVGGIDLIPTFVALLGHHLDLTVVIDSQKSGHQKISRLADKGYLSNKRIITIGEILKRNLADIEDLFSIANYLKIYNKSFGEDIKENDLTGTGQIISKICRYKNISEFDHGKPADHFLRERDKILPSLSSETLDNFELLFKKINSTLSK